MEFIVGMHLLGERIYLMISNYAAYLEIDTQPSNQDNLKGCIFFNIDFADKGIKIHLRRTFQAIKWREIPKKRGLNWI